MKVKIAYLQTPSKIGPFTALTTVSPETVKTSAIYRLEDGSLGVDIAGVTYIIPSANVKLMAVEKSENVTEIKRK
jgi:hypothetical protein